MAGPPCAMVLPPDAEPFDLSRLSRYARALIAACGGAAEAQRSSRSSAAIGVSRARSSLRVKLDRVRGAAESQWQ